MFQIILLACILWCHSKCESLEKHNLTLFEIINRNIESNVSLNESGLDDQILSKIRPEDPNLQQLMNGLLNLNMPKINEERISEFFNGLMENPKVNEFGQQAVAVLRGFKDIQNLFRDPKNVANTLTQAIRNLPLDKIVNQMGGDSNNFANQLLATLKTGQLPSLTETALNPCKNLMNCSVVGQNYEDFKAVINLIDLESFSEILNNPTTILNNILSSKFRELVSNSARNVN